MTEAIALGLACWIATMVVVESELFRPLREWLDRRYIKHGRVHQNKLRYLVSCHLCTGTWIALAIQAVAPIHVVTGVGAFVLNALFIKAIGHGALIAQNAIAK